MTTIATDGWIVAYDTRMIRGASVSGTDCDKAVLLPDGRIAAAAGRWTDALAFFDYLRAIFTDAAEPKPELADDEFIGFVAGSGRVWAYDAKLLPFEVDAPYCIGAGDDVARGAMQMGADPVRAIEVAMEIGTHHTGGKVRFLGQKPIAPAPITMRPGESMKDYRERAMAEIYDRPFINAEPSIPQHLSRGQRRLGESVEDYYRRMNPVVTTADVRREPELMIRESRESMIARGAVTLPAETGGVTREGKVWLHWRKGDHRPTDTRVHARNRPSCLGPTFRHQRIADSTDYAHRRATDPQP